MTPRKSYARNEERHYIRPIVPRWYASEAFDRNFVCSGKHIALEPGLFQSIYAHDAGYKLQDAARQG